MRLPWECHDQSQVLNGVTEPQLPFFHKRKDILKIDQSVKMPRHKLSMGVACSYSSAPGIGQLVITRRYLKAIDTNPAAMSHSEAPADQEQLYAQLYRRTLFCV